MVIIPAKDVFVSRQLLFFLSIQFLETTFFKIFIFFSFSLFIITDNFSYFFSVFILNLLFLFPKLCYTKNYSPVFSHPYLHSCFPSYTIMFFILQI